MGGIVMAATISANSAGGGGLVSSGDASGVLALQTAGVTALSIDASQKVTFANSLTSPTLTSPVINGMGSSILTSGTAVASTSGTSIDFTGIPSWVKRITVMFNGVSTNGTTPVTVQLGVSGTPQTSGYLGIATNQGTTTSVYSYLSNGFALMQAGGAGTVFYGQIIICNMGSNIWTASGQVGRTDNTFLGSCQGAVTLTGVLNLARITVNGTDTFDAGSINIMYE